MVQDRAIVTMTNSKFYIICRSGTRPNPDYKVMPMFDFEYLSNGKI